MKLHAAWHRWNPLTAGPRKWLLAVLLPALAPIALAAADAPMTRTGQVEAGGLVELSGIAVSRLVPGRWWGHNDSGNAAELFAFDGSGKSLGVVETPIASFDWEDIASYEQNGTAYLAVADTGDNFSIRAHVEIRIFAEPGTPLPAKLAPLRTIEFRFEDGSRDCEGLAADPAHDRFLLIDKGRQPVGLYSVPMGVPTGPVVAKRIADLPLLWLGPVPATAPADSARWRGNATALDLSPDGLRMLVTTYRHLAEFTRKPDQDWPAAIRETPPRLLRLPKDKSVSVEAAGYDASGKGALVSGEGRKAAVYRWDGRFPDIAPVAPSAAK